MVDDKGHLLLRVFEVMKNAFGYPASIDIVYEYYYHHDGISLTVAIWQWHTS